MNLARAGADAEAMPPPKRQAAAAPAKKAPPSSRREKPAKAAQVRFEETVVIRAKLLEAGLREEHLRAIDRDLAAFSEQGVGCTREYRVPELGVAVMVQLSLRPHVTSFARLRGLPPPA